MAEKGAPTAKSFGQKLSCGMKFYPFSAEDKATSKRSATYAEKKSTAKS